MDVATKLKKARVQLLLRSPFFASIVLKLPLEEDPRVDTIATDGSSIHYNGAWIEKLELEELVGVLAHEAMHLALLHPLRRQHRQLKTWNRACDYAVDPLLRGFQLPGGAHIDPRFEGKYAEEIYEILHHEQQNQEKLEEAHQTADPGTAPQQGAGKPDRPGADNPAPDPGGNGAVMDPDPSANLQELESNLRQIVASAHQTARSQGNLPSELERAIEELLYPQIPWRELLRRFVEVHVKSDWSWLKPDKRYVHRNVYLPSLSQPELQELVVAVDTSGSISQRELDTFATEITALVEQYAKGCKVIYCDSEIQGCEEFEGGQAIKLRPRGGGGTDFRPVFDLIEKRGWQPPVLIYLTDLECTRYPEQPPPYPVLWVSTQKDFRTPPFGDVITIQA